MIRWLLPLFPLVVNRASRGLVLLILVAAASAPGTFEFLSRTWIKHPR